MPKETGVCKRLRKSYVEDDATKKPEDFIISSGKAYSVKYFIDLTLKYLKINGKWIGKNNERKFVNNENKTIIEISPKLIRKNDYKLLIGDSSKAKRFFKMETEN